jgi:signal transduction histidine kinase
VTREVLDAAGITSHPCRTVEELGSELAAGAGAILIAAEALRHGAAEALAACIARQEPWSDIPVVLAAEGGRPPTLAAGLGGADGVGVVTVLERPIRGVTLQTVLQAALRARRRQYQLRDAIAELRDHVERLDAERVVRERFVTLLAHDLRGPLSTASLGARRLAVDAAQDPARREAALRVERAMARMDGMIRDLLDANRVRAGERLPLELQPCDLVAVVDEALTELDEASRGRVRPAAPARLEGMWAPDQLRRAVWNLVTNALKYGSPDAPVDVVLRREGHDAVVAVHNHGAPIAPDELHRIFEPFGRARGLDPHVRGWGLGLALVRGCAEAHGGAVEVTSTAGEGTTFAMRLPLDARANVRP